ncbi:peptide chain release factor N(5)-glutamine methyltransferase [Aliiroseovarius sp. 2305UL8-7]|uniref:peptide chain release factor N(5)-glutamine methyltransferase n=1 Tax=Aliiroseovarius conchicola TaxID=3121637 RepID=UPI00352751AD
MTTGSALLVGAVRRLKAAGVDDPARDARILLAYAIGIERSRLTLVLPDDVPEVAEAAFERAIEARTARQPVAQITGSRAFYGRDFIVTSDVLDPRPDTELLVDLALGQPFETVLDLGAGSGCILLTLLAENEKASGQGGDISPAALDVARRNAALLSVEDRAEFRLGSWFDSLEVGQRFDLIVSNPPYITSVEMNDLSPEVRNWEPHLALTPGGDGLAAYREITQKAADHLEPNGWLMVEIGSTQGSAVQALFQQAGFGKVSVQKDLAGHDRVVTGRIVDPA